MENTKPVFNLSLTWRCGSHFLKNLLCLHPDCCFNEVSHEDRLINKSYILEEYINETYFFQNLELEKGSVNKEDLLSKYLAHLGKAILSYYYSYSDRKKRVLFKTPDVHNIENTFKLFPEAYLLILVRDGRSCIESLLNTNWDWLNINFSGAVQIWTEGAKKIYEFDKKNRNRNFNYLIIKYESLVSDVKSEMTRILDFLRLDVENYDFDRARELKVANSSFIKYKDLMSKQKGVNRPELFDPCFRFRDWDASKHELYNRHAGKYMDYFGYEKMKL